MPLAVVIIDVFTDTQASIVISHDRRDRLRTRQS